MSWLNWLELRWLVEKLEDRLFWWLERRWRQRSTIEDLKRHRAWLILDIHTKGGTVDPK